MLSLPFKLAIISLLLCLFARWQHINRSEKVLLVVRKFWALSYFVLTVLTLIFAICGVIKL